MCVSPILIPNPNYNNHTELIQLTTDTESQFIRVPCGVCGECLQKRQSDIVQRCRCLALDHYMFFFTLTYNRESLPHFTTSSGVTINYADYSDIQKMFKRIRKVNAFGREFKYLCVSERGSHKGRPHFHGIIFIQKQKEDDSLYTAVTESKVRNTIFKEWKRNYGSSRNPDWKPLFTYRSKYVAGKRFSNFDCHYIVPHSTEKGSDDVAFYVSKYVLKPSKVEAKLQQALKLNLDEPEYLETWKIVKSRCFWSKGFGAFTELEKNYVRSCVHRSSNDPNGFQYFNADGTKSGLARYYRKYIDADSAIKSVSARGGPLSIDDRPISDKVTSVDNINRIRGDISSRDISEFTTD